MSVFSSRWTVLAFRFVILTKSVSRNDVPPYAKHRNSSAARATDCTVPRSARTIAFGALSVSAIVRRREGSWCARVLASSSVVAVYSVDPISDGFGGVIRGVDAARSITGRQQRFLLDALVEYDVLVLRDQVLSPRQHVEFMQNFGEVSPASALTRGIDGEPRVKSVDSRRPASGANDWHSDMTFLEVPPIVTSLYGRVLPPVGGDTWFASARRALNNLPPDVRRSVDPLSAVHHDAGLGWYLRQYGPATWQGKVIKRHRPVTHPVVVTCPLSGADSLFVNPFHTARILGSDEDPHLLDVLFDELLEPRGMIKIAWSMGTLVVSNNWTTIHRGVNDYAPHARILHKVSVVASRPRRSTFDAAPGALGQASGR